MNAKVRSRIERGRRALEYSRAHADQSAGYTTTLTRLEERLARCDALADQQLDGVHAVRSATARKDEIRRVLTGGHLRHLVKVGRLAAAELPELAERLVLPPRTSCQIPAAPFAPGGPEVTTNRPSGESATCVGR